MSTTTLEPPTDTDIDFEEWLNGDKEIRCQLAIFLFHLQCPHPAAWVMYYIPQCECSKTRSVYICNSCHDAAVRGNIGCVHCQTKPIITWLERTKS